MLKPVTLSNDNHLKNIIQANQLPYCLPLLITEQQSNSDSNLIINVNNLSKKFAEHTAVTGVDLQVKAGEIYGFLGP